MSTDNSTLAEELEKSHQEISVAEFFNKNKQMLGFDSKSRALVTTIKEGVDNALDASEEARILPNISVTVKEKEDYYQIRIKDNGPGITEDNIPNVFGKLLYGSRFMSRSQSLPYDEEVLIERNGAVEYMKIGDIVESYLKEEGHQQIPDTMKTPSFNRQTGEAEWESVTGVSKHKTEHDLFRITTERGRTVTVTGNHSLFTLDLSDTDSLVSEKKAAEIDKDTSIIAPQNLPQVDSDEGNTLNMLNAINVADVSDNRVYVYDIDPSLIQEIIDNGEKKRISEGYSKKRTVYEYNGCEILKDSLEQNYLPNSYLPAETVLRLGWEEKVSDGIIRTYKVGGEITEHPVSVKLEFEFMRFLGHYIAEGHAEERQFALTFGSHETDYVEHTENVVGSILGLSTTTVQRERNSTRVKGFGGIVPKVLKNLCGDCARQKQVPDFVFNMPAPLQAELLNGLYQGDGSDKCPSNVLTHTTVSETLAKQMSTLWNMLGVNSSFQETTSYGCTDEPTTTYVTEVYGEPVSKLPSFTTSVDSRQTTSNRISKAELEEFNIRESTYKTVPATAAGVLLGIGLANSYDQANEYADYIDSLSNNEAVVSPHICRLNTLIEHNILHKETELTEFGEEIADLCKRTERFGESDICTLSVKNVEKVDRPEFVYDISVPGQTGSDENFLIANSGGIYARNSRGQQGLGISAAVLYAQQTSGKPATVISKTRSNDTAYKYDVRIDTDTNEPQIADKVTDSYDYESGTEIILEMVGNMRGRKQLEEYIKNTAILNPYATITIDAPNLSYSSDRVIEELPEKPEPIKPHPHGTSLGQLIDMLEETEQEDLSAFLKNDFTKVGAKTADNIIKNYNKAEFGKEFVFPTKNSERINESIEQNIFSIISRKSTEAKQKLSDCITEKLLNENSDGIKYSEIHQTVYSCADDVEDECDERIGETVRDNIVGVILETLLFNSVPDFQKIVSSETSKRKTRSVTDKLTVVVLERLASDTSFMNEGIFTEEYIQSAIENAVQVVQNEYDTPFGDTALENVKDVFWSEYAETSVREVPSLRSLLSNRDKCSSLRNALSETKVHAPSSKCLSPIGESLIESGLRQEYDADYYTASQRTGGVYKGSPFVVEAGVAYGGELDENSQISIQRYANKVPLVYQQSACAITNTVEDISWRNYKLKQSGSYGIPVGPMILVVHIASTNVRFKSEAKNAISNIPGLEDEIELAVREVARGVKKHIKKQEALKERQEKQEAIDEVINPMAEAFANVLDTDRPDTTRSTAKIMNNVGIQTVGASNEEIELLIYNYNSTQYSFTITLDETDEQVTVSPNEQEKIGFDCDDVKNTRLQVSGIEEERLSHNLIEDGRRKTEAVPLVTFNGGKNQEG